MDPAVICGLEDGATTLEAPLHRQHSRSSSPGQHDLDPAKHPTMVYLDQPAPPKHYVPQQHIVYDAHGTPYVQYVAPPMVRCYPVMVNQVNGAPQPVYRSAGEPRQVSRPQGYCSAGEPGRYAPTVRLVQASGNSVGRTHPRVLTELSQADVRTMLTTRGSVPPQQGSVAGVATMVGAVPHAARSARVLSHQAGQFGPPRPMAYASDPNLGARVVLTSRRGHSAGSRVVLHDSFATVSDMPEGGQASHTTAQSSGSFTAVPVADNRPTVAAANPYALHHARRVPNPFAAHAERDRVPARLNSGLSTNSSTSAHVLEPAGASTISEPGSSPQAATIPVVSLLRAAASQPPRGDSAELLTAKEAKPAAVVVGRPRVWTGDSVNSDEMVQAVGKPAAGYVMGKNNVPRPAPVKKARGFACCGGGAVIE